jgi:hypothetical protein
VRKAVVASSVSVVPVQAVRAGTMGSIGMGRYYLKRSSYVMQVPAAREMEGCAIVVVSSSSVPSIGDA